MFINGNIVSGNNNFNGENKSNADFKKQSTYESLDYLFSNDDEHP
jgi:hypothetical protein